VDEDQAEKLEKQLKSGKGMTLEDFRDQLRQIKKMGGLGSIMEKLPGMGKMGGAMPDMGEDQLKHMEAMINAMTPWERRHASAIKANRKRRIASGSGTSVQEVNKLLKQFDQMQKAMKRMKKQGGMKKMMEQMGGGDGGQGFPF